MQRASSAQSLPVAARRAAGAAVEWCWPADAQSAAVLRGWAEHGGGDGVPGYLETGSGAGTGL